jgi:hypothetical protein
MAIASSLFDDFTFHNKLVYLSADVFLENAPKLFAAKLINQKDFFMSDQFKCNPRYLSQKQYLKR